MSGQVLSGGCLCGTIRFEAAAWPSTVANCHCSMCRRASGAAFLPYAAYRTADVRFLGADPIQYRSSDEAFRGFCATCGSSLYFSYDAEPERIWMTLGCFDDPTALWPNEDWYVGNKMPWLSLDNRLTHWPEAPGWVTEVTGRPSKPLATSTRQGPVEADIGYWDPGSGKPVSYAYEPKPGIEQLTWPIVNRMMAIGDARLLPERPTLDRSGFELISEPSAVSNFADPDQIRRVYYREAESLLTGLTSASRAIVFDHTIRSRPAGVDRLGLREPILRAHVDYTTRSGQQRVRDLLGDESRALLARRFAIVNLWRSIAGTVEELPLAVCDGRSVAPRDFVACEMRYEDRTGEIYVVQHNPGHDWFYFPAMTPDEALLFKNYDSCADDTVRFTPHSAFIDPTTPRDARPRASIELRVLLFW